MPSSELISELRRKTVQPNIIISGTKIFDENNLKIFALRCSSPLIKSIWNKPDFNDIDEIIPHISIFESAEDDKIQIVRRFFKENPIELFLNRVKVTLYQANSPYLSIFPKYPFNDELGKILNLPQNFIKDAIRIGEILKKN
ncbi:MAG: hypothetical protein ORN98_01895 [Alphaproteobacteria bacterium]|nr:hypothetical protein [Alphaproteobacteria bacterium]